MRDSASRPRSRRHSGARNGACNPMRMIGELGRPMESRKKADLAQELAAASQKRSTGVARIKKAMGQVDQATQRNASSAED